MRLYVAGSSSSGNCYLLYDEREILILECGVPFKNINGLPFFDLEKVVGCVISHEHGDHAGRMNEFLDYGVDCLASSGTISSLSFTSKRLPLMIEEGVTVMAGAFSILFGSNALKRIFHINGKDIVALQFKILICGMYGHAQLFKLDIGILCRLAFSFCPAGLYISQLFLNIYFGTELYH